MWLYRMGALYKLIIWLMSPECYIFLCNISFFLLFFCTKKFHFQKQKSQLEHWTEFWTVKVYYLRYCGIKWIKLSNYHCYRCCDRLTYQSHCHCHRDDVALNDLVAHWDPLVVAMVYDHHRLWDFAICHCHPVCRWSWTLIAAAVAQPLIHVAFALGFLSSPRCPIWN